MSLGVRQQGEIAYLRGALGLDELEARVAKLENEEDYVGQTLEERHSRGLANLARLDVYPAEEFSPEGEPDPEGTEENKIEHGVVNPDETVQESNPAVAVDPEVLAAVAAYEEMTVEQLKDELRNRELPTSGSKSDLVARLEEDDATS